MKRNKFGVELCCLANVLIFLSSCSSHNQVTYKQTGNYKVSVIADGEEIKDFNKSLIHRVAISSAKLQDLTKTALDEGKISFVVEAASNGEVLGLRVVASEQSLLRSLSLEVGDLITAINLTVVRAETDLQLLFDSLATKSVATITIQRLGEPHKLLYSLRDDG